MITYIIIIIHYLINYNSIKTYKLLIPLLTTFLSSLVSFINFRVVNNKFLIKLNVNIENFKYFLLLFLTTFIFTIGNNILLNIIKKDE